MSILLFKCDSLNFSCDDPSGKIAIKSQSTHKLTLAVASALWSSHNVCFKVKAYDIGGRKTCTEYKYGWIFFESSV